jgi:hypothetical protein
MQIGNAIWRITPDPPRTVSTYQVDRADAPGTPAANRCTFDGDFNNSCAAKCCTSRSAQIAMEARVRDEMPKIHIEEQSTVCDHYREGV